MKYLIISLIAFFFASCKKESYTLQVAYFINKSGHTIEIKPYFNGVVPPQNIIRLQLNDSLKFGEGSSRGIVGADAGFSSKLLPGTEDSVWVVFDGGSHISHYYKNPTLLAPKYYLYTSLRNLGNIKAYVSKSTDLSKTSRLNEFWYTFTEQDYLDAK